ncbi:glycosyltransferase family 4 protein [Jannaschia sp. LMIT008]|uniref:glycosyltransferase family 4 protein n=1 Tax=Jannaschia maritima TaxID=3032585 RepID=UPI002811A45B|nr:glycosyltransferase [Jannaschia sp. LMIT008]
MEADETPPPAGDDGPARPIVLVVPSGAVNPRTGGGQRSRILFDGLRRVGTVTVAVLGLREGDTGAAEFFPGAADFVPITTPSFMVQKTDRAAKLKLVGTRLLLPDMDHAADADVRRRLKALGSPDAVYAFRYARPFTHSGLTRADAALLAVDLDDRDDRKTRTQIEGRLRMPGGAAAARLVARRIAGTLRRRLSGADVVWLAKPDDRFDGIGAAQPVLPNVPFHDPPDDVPSADEGDGLLFVGTYEHKPNRDGVAWFLSECWPRIRLARPDATVRIVGLGGWGSIRARFDGRDGIHIVGTVDAVGPEYVRARAAISPIHEGAGTQIKVVEACGYGRPVVATTMSGSGFGDAMTSIIRPCDGADAFADRCIAYLSDPALAASDGTALRDIQSAQASRGAAEAQVAADVRAGLAARGTQS